MGQEPNPLNTEEKVSTVQHEHGIHRTQHELVEAAVAFNEEQLNTPKRVLFREYAPAVLYSAGLSLALVMEGMDVGLINNFFGHPAFIRQFGWPGEDGELYISATWQGAIGAGNNCGSIIGLLLNGYLQSKYGSRRVYMFAMALMGATIFILFFSVSVEMLLVGNILCGIPWGIFQTLTTAYAAEICPAALRGYLTAWVSMCWGAGSFLATGILRGALELEGDAGWQVPYGLQWIWVLPLFIIAWFCPESPWYLIRKERDADCEKSLRRLARKGYYTDETMAEQIAYMKHTNEMEKLQSAEASYRDCFRGTNLRRTGIVCMAWVIQILNGQSITNYAAILLQNVGMGATDAFNFNMAIQSVNIVATGIAICLMGRIGRRTFYFWGSSGIGFCMLMTGIMGSVGLGQEDVAISVAVFLILVQIVFKISLGPTTYVVVAETSSSRVRAQTVVLGRAVYIVGQIIVQQINPRFLLDGPDSWNLGAQTGFFYFALCFIWAVWIFFKLPETKNRSFADLDYLFQKHTPARKFATAEVNLFEFYDEKDSSTEFKQVPGNTKAETQV